MNSLITLTSDYGSGSHYTAALMGKAITLMPEVMLTEITHSIPMHDQVQAAFILNLVFREFPVGTCHIIAVDTSITLHQQYLFVEHEGHYFIGADNGVFNLMFDPLPTKVYRILASEYSEDELFPEKNVFLPFLAKFLKRGDLKGIAEPGNILNQKKSLQPVITENGIKGVVVIIDGFGNAISNIHRSVFERERKNRQFRLYYWNKIYIDKISTRYNDGSAGDDLLLFNERGFLTIAMSGTRGARLLGLKPQSSLIIEFEEGAA